MMADENAAIRLIRVICVICVLFLDRLSWQKYSLVGRFRQPNRGVFVLYRFAIPPHLAYNRLTIERYL